MEWPLSSVRAIAIGSTNGTRAIYMAKGKDNETNEFWYSANDGGAWKQLALLAECSGLPIGGVAVSDQDAGRVWVTFESYQAGCRVIFSRDEGTTWSDLSNDLPALPFHAVAYAGNGMDAVYVGADVGVFYRDNTRDAWVPFMNGLPNVIVSDLEIHAGTNKIRAATYGRGVWESDLYTPCPSTLEIPESEPLPVGNTVFSADESITSAATLPGGASVNVRYQAGKNITLQPEFRVGSGATFQAAIRPCTAAPPPIPLFGTSVEKLFGV